VATSITALIGRALRGPVNEPIRIQNFGEFERQFGGLWIDSTMSYAVQHYFLNGGTDAIIVRLVKAATKASFSLAPSSGITDLLLEASSEGDWGNNLRIAIDGNIRPDADPNTVFNLIVTEIDPTTNQLRQQETFRNVSIEPTASRYLGKVLAQESRLLRVPDPYSGTLPAVRPQDVSQDLSASPPNFGASPSVSGSDGDPLTFTQYEGSRSNKIGIYALEKADLFNLLCIPPFTRDSDVAPTTWEAAVKYCEDRRALLIVDPPSNWKAVADVTDSGTSGTGVDSLNLRKKNAAIYFPRLKMADPLQENRLEEFVPCGVVAGIYARTDANRGVWKAPAGIEATLTGVRELSVKLTDGENGQLNPLGVNCLRNFPVIGNVVWGARTLEGADRLASEWKYVPVRRMALFIEESLYRGTQWVVFEPNDEPLWAQIRLNVGAFMQNLFRQGAFQGKSPREAYLVKCDKETTTQNDINLGIVNIVVGFAPLKPAEFVIIKIQQLAGQIAT
jgi:hypothetical protein